MSKKCSSSNIKGLFIFPSITFFIELVINYSELKDKFFYASINRDLDQRYIVKPGRENDSLLCLVAVKKKPSERIRRKVSVKPEHHSAIEKSTLRPTGPSTFFISFF
jgi:hypothetical protein